MRCPGRSGRYDVALTYAELEDAANTAVDSEVRFDECDLHKNERAPLARRPLQSTFALGYLENTLSLKRT